MGQVEVFFVAMFCGAPLYDYSHFDPPTRLGSPLQNPLVPPRTDLGEVKERLACLEKKNSRVSLQHLLGPRLSERRTRKLTPDDSSPSSRKNPAERSGTRIGTVKSSLLSFRPNRGSLAGLKGAPKSLSDASENPASPIEDLQIAKQVQLEITARLLETQERVSVLQAKLEDCGTREDSKKQKISESLLEQVTILSALRMHSKIMQDRHEKGYLEVRIANTNSLYVSESVAPFAKFYFYLNFPHLCCYESEEVRICHSFFLTDSLFS